MMPPPILWIAVAFAALSFLEALYSFSQGRRLARRFLDAHGERPPFAPPVVLILPFKGVDPGLERNLGAFFEQRYSDLRVLLVTGGRDDTAVPLVERVRAAYPAVPSTLLVAGRAAGRGQKVHNLLHALDHLRDADRVLAFGDSDIRPGPRWLRDLVAPLGDPSVAVSTGFRWYLPTDGRLVSWLRSLWNAGILGLFAGDRAPFAWGGALALRRETLDAIEIRGAWRGAVSDDFALSRAVLQRGGRIRFEPRCLSFTHENCTLRQLLEWSHRQLAVTRVYEPSLWRLGFVSEVVNGAVFWGGIAVGAVQLSIIGGAVPVVALLTLVGAIYTLRCAKSRLRVRAVIGLFPEHRPALERRLWAYTLLGPLTSLVTLLAFVRTLVGTDIEWRGMKYRMVSPTRTKVVDM
jgi:hypothetical protein